MDLAEAVEEEFVKDLILRVKLKLSLEDIVNGVQKKIKVQKLVAASGVEFTSCSSCRGSGQVTRVTNTILEQCKQPQHVQTAKVRDK